MRPKITESHRNYGINIGRIVRRIVEHVPGNCLEDLKEIRILDKDPDNQGLACYLKNEGRIEIFAYDLIGDLPWVIKKTYILPYVILSMALGHEIDHHVNALADNIDKEKSAENNALRYVYPSFGIFKPIAKLLSFMFSR